MQISKITSKGQITLPSVVRKDMKLETGDNVVFIKAKKGYMMFNETDVERGMINMDTADEDEEL